MPWPLPDGDDELLRLAKGYPYATPGHSYLYRSDAVVPLEAANGEVFAGRVPVVAHGSNRSPHQIHRKFGTWSPDESEIPVSRAWLSDYDVVYSAHVTRYGSIAANLQHKEGARVELYVTWLDDRQLTRMHETEMGGKTYDYGHLTGVTLELEEGPAPQVGEVSVYLSRRGCLSRDDRPVALAASAGNGRHPALAQEDILSFVRDRFRPEKDLDLHILETIRETSARKRLIEEMMAAAVPPNAPHFVRELP